MYEPHCSVDAVDTGLNDWLICLGSLSPAEHVRVEQVYVMTKHHYCFWLGHLCYMLVCVQDRIRHMMQRLLMRDAPKINQVSAEDSVSTPQPAITSGSDCMTEEEHVPTTLPTLTGRSLMIFGPTNPLRMFLARIVWHPRFEHMIIALIICSSIVLAIDSPSVQQGSTLKTVLVHLAPLLYFWLITWHQSH